MHRKLAVSVKFDTKSVEPFFDFYPLPPKKIFVRLNINHHSPFHPEEAAEICFNLFNTF